jgi:hypothetical protein
VVLQVAVVLRVVAARPGEVAQAVVAAPHQR